MPGVAHTNASRPVQIPGLSDVATLSAGTGLYYFIKNDGTLWVLGDHYWGQLGIGGSRPAWGTEGHIYTPAQVTSLSNVVALSGGYLHSVVSTEDGTLWAYGTNGDGQLGIGSYDMYDSFNPTPQQVSIGTVKRP